MTNEEEIRKEFINTQEATEELCCNGDYCSSGCAKRKAEKVADWWIAKLKAQDKIAREEIVKKIEKGFDEFLLQDWSGEVEVENEIERLKGIIISSLIN